MQNQNFDKLRSILKEKGTKPLSELAGKLKKSDYKTKQMLLVYLYNEIATLHPETDMKKYKHLYKVFKYFEDVKDEKEKIWIIENLEKSARLCTRRINKLKKENKLSSTEPNIIQKLLDIINVSLINLKYKEIVKSRELSANDVSYDLLTYLIYEVRNYNYLFELLKLFPQNLVVKNKNGVYLIDELIMKYIELVKNNKPNSDIIYFEKVIKLFITDPKFYIDVTLEKELIRKLEYVLTEIKDSDAQNREKNKSTFFINEAIRDIKKIEDENRSFSHLNFKYDIHPGFSKDVLKEASKTVTLDTGEQVLDCRDKYTVTVDKETTWVYDDACSLEELPNGNYLLGIYVADATIAVPKGSLHDIEARRRAESIYPGGEVITMLPKDLTLSLTLKANADRNAIGYFFELDKDMNCINFSVRRCLINVNNNYSYDKVNAMLTDSRDIEEIKNLKNMYYISTKFHNNSTIRMQYRTLKKIKKAISSEGIKTDTLSPLDLSNNIAAMMIAEFMAETNAYVADYFNKHPEIPFIYRINLSSYGDDVISKIKSIGGSNLSFEDMLNYINYICPPSIYSTVNLGHNGLNLPAYCHATNPLRNYSSLEIERIIIDHMINDGRDVNLEENKKYLEQLCVYMNNRIGLDNDYVEEVKRLYKKNQEQIVDK